ncbi:MAG: hypothetical protein RIC95_02970 [Vicingaceae bacterium]
MRLLDKCDPNQLTFYITNIRLEDFSHSVRKKVLRLTSEYNIKIYEVDFKFYETRYSDITSPNPLDDGDESSLFLAKTFNGKVITNSNLIMKAAKEEFIQVIKFDEFVDKYLADKNDIETFSEILKIA